VRRIVRLYLRPPRGARVVCVDEKTQQQILEARRWPRGRLIIVADNLSIHTHPNVRAWVADPQYRVQLVFLPLHASWLNQIELWFSVLERQCLKRASLRTRAAMAARIYAFARHWNRTARPFRWTFKGYPLRR
jgi:transposase